MAVIPVQEIVDEFRNNRFVSCYLGYVFDMYVFKPLNNHKGQ